MADFERLNIIFLDGFFNASAKILYKSILASRIKLKYEAVKRRI